MSVDENQPNTTTHLISGVMLWVMRCLIIIALAISTYLLIITRMSGIQIIGCTGGSQVIDCLSVLTSKWSTVRGLPTSVLAIGLYLGMLYSTTQLHRDRSAWAALTLLSFIAIGAAVWFIGLQVFIVGSVCIWCMAAHACALAIGAIVLIHSPITRRFKSLVKHIGVAAVAVGLLIGVQVATPGVTPGAGAGLAKRNVQFLKGQLNVPLGDVSILGDVTAPRVLISMFDYTCPRCSTMHEYLADARKHFGGGLAIVMLPSPLDATCNPLFTTTDKRHAHGCEYAKLAMAVWRADSTQFEAYDTWLFNEGQPLNVAKARKKAEKLIGPDALVTALADPWVADRIAGNVGLYARMPDNMQRLPLLIFGDDIYAGLPADSNEIIKLLDHAGVSDSTTITAAQPAKLKQSP